MIFPWQTSAWENWTLLLQRLPHAMVIRAGEGEGVFEFAHSAAQSLLCESPLANRQACGKCAACTWFDQGNHPDFRLIVPDSIAADAPDEERESVKKEKRSQQVRIEQIRALSNFLAIGTHRAGWRVILVYPADTMNANTQNALLKSLEEPPPATVFLLATTRPDRLLPTVRSRCRNFALPPPDPAQATAWLKGQGVAQIDILLARAGGAPLAALLADKNETAHSQFLEGLQDPRMDPIVFADRAQRMPPLEVVDWLQRWAYDLLSFRLAGRVRFHCELEKVIAETSRSCEAGNLAGYLRQLAQARALAQHPLNPRLFVEDLLLGYQRAVSRT
jgi:DNA polymerase-3 subunit delta'